MAGLRLYSLTMRHLHLALPLALGLLLLLIQSAQASSPHVFRADLNGDINNIAAGYVASTLQQAENEHAAAYLLVLNAPVPIPVGVPVRVIRRAGLELEVEPAPVQPPA